MTTKDIRSNKIFRSVWNQLSQIIAINTYHGRDDVERSVRIINAMTKRAEERIAAGRDEAEVMDWLSDTISCFKTKEGGYTFDEITAHWRNEVNALKTSAIEQLTSKIHLLNKLAQAEHDVEKARSIKQDVAKYVEAIDYINTNINYNV